jgi:hypothetical protein
VVAEVPSCWITENRPLSSFAAAKSKVYIVQCVVLLVCESIEEIRFVRYGLQGLIMRKDVLFDLLQNVGQERL